MNQPRRDQERPTAVSRAYRITSTGHQLTASHPYVLGQSHTQHLPSGVEVPSSHLSYARYSNIMQGQGHSQAHNSFPQGSSSSATRVHPVGPTPMIPGRASQAAHVQQRTSNAQAVANPANPQYIPQAGPTPHVSHVYDTQTSLADILTRLPAAMSSMQGILLERLVRIEDSVRDSQRISERLEKIETEMHEARSQAAAESRSMAAFLEQVTRTTSNSFKTVAKRVKHVEDMLGVPIEESSSHPDPTGSGTESCQADGASSSKSSMMTRMTTIECLLTELLEKVMDPDAASTYMRFFI